MIINVIEQPTSLVKLAHRLLAEKIKPGAAVIDATVGNGYDTLFLLDLAKPNGKVYGFDIQANALRLTKDKLQHSPDAACVELIHASHADMAGHIPAPLHGNIAAVMFNLGYLPGGDKHIITQADSTLAALGQAIALMAPGGLLTILAYPGHAGGDHETAKVNHWCERLNPERFVVNLYETARDNPATPQLFVVNKLA